MLQKHWTVAGRANEIFLWASLEMQFPSVAVLFEQRSKRMPLGRQRCALAVPVERMDVFCR